MEDNLANIGLAEGNVPTETTAIVPEVVAPQWYVDEGVPGMGARPEYLEEKYGYVMAKQAKAYKDAQKLLGTLRPAPEEYDFGEQQEYIDKENHHIKNFILYAKENKIQQETFGKVINTLVEYDKSKQPNTSDEIAKLGSDGIQKINTLQNWIKNNLTPESAKALEKLPVRAEVVLMLDEVRQLHMNTLAKIPADTQKGPAFSPISKAEIEAEMFANYPKYQNDPAYRAQITAKFAQLMSSGKE
jgi:hypothetical protein